MTGHAGSHASGGSARPPRQPGWRVGTPVVVLLSGALFAVSAVDSGGSDLRPGRFTNLSQLVEAESREVDGIRADLRALEDEVDALAADIDSYRVRRARAEIEPLRDPSGMLPASGPGITIELSDSPTDVFEEAEAAGEDDLGRLNVHQQDIQAVVNALWNGGAEAVTIAGQRVVSTTGIKCEGNAVQIHGQPYPQPFVVQAVGDPTALLTAVQEDPIVSGYRADAEDPAIQIGWDLRVETEVEAPGYDGLVDMRYAQVLR